MEPYPECAQKPYRQPPSAEQVLQALYQREQKYQSVEFNQFKTFENLDIDRDKLLMKYTNHYELPKYKLII